ncbi:CD5 antigen-like [Pygocentrus nattereri]|uniref:CD5 antigen-like n=1 Tax=Pygocentrus nattereri TaxID=42514 RepID=UPI000814A0D2|nr:CD5 antigen-like [Pygocentrus nattereri]
MSLCDYECFPTAQNQIALRGPDSPCEGRLEVYNDGEWGLVCYHGWNSENGQDRKNGEVVCRSLGCGQHVESGHNKDSYKNHQLPTKYWMDEVRCSGTENNLWNCKKPRVTHCKADNYVTVKCSGSIELSLNRNGKMDESAGVV